MHQLFFTFSILYLIPLCTCNTIKHDLCVICLTDCLVCELAEERAGGTEDGSIPAGRVGGIQGGVREIPGASAAGRRHQTPPDTDG